MSDLISIEDAVAHGIERLRQPIWANPLDHLKIDVINGTMGPWVRLFSPLNRGINGRDPMEMLAFQVNTRAKEYEAYTNALPDSEEYKAAQSIFDGAAAIAQQASGMRQRVVKHEKNIHRRSGMEL